MVLIFDDLIKATDCSGLYTLTGYVNGTWQDIHTIYGPTTGSIEVDASYNTIEVDTTLFVPGETYQFRWVDGNGVSSNIIKLTIPTGSGPDYYYSSGSGSGATSPSIMIIEAEVGQIEIMLNGISGGYSSPQYTVNGNGNGPFDFTENGDGSFTLTGSDIVAGASVQANMYINELGGYIYSQMVTIPDTGSYSSSGYESGSRVMPSTIQLLGLNDGGSGNTMVAFSANIAKSNIAGYLMDVTASVNTSEFLTFAGHVFFPASTFTLPFMAGHVYQFALVDLDANPSGNISDPSTILSNTMTATGNAIDSVTNDAGSISINMSYDITTIPLTIINAFMCRPDGSDLSGLGVRYPMSLAPSNPQTYPAGYVSGDLIQYAILDPSNTSNILSATVFTTLP